MASYPDILTGKMDPVSHYVLHGAGEGKNPAPWFNTREYLQKNKYLSNIDINPFFHYLYGGCKDSLILNEKAL